MIAEYLEGLQNDSICKGWAHRDALRPGLIFYDSAFSVEFLRDLTPLREREWEILFCDHGRMEIHLAERRVQFVGPGDLLILTQTAQSPAMFFPLGQFQCKMIHADAGVLGEAFEKITADFLGWPDSRQRLQGLLKKHHGCMVFRDALWNSEFQEAMAQLPLEKQGRYFLLSIWERLYFLCQKESGSESPPILERYYDQYQREAVRMVHDYMLAHMEESLTIQELAKKFQMSPTFLKSCFRQLYGQPIHAYLQQHRLQQAARLLATTTDSVLQVAAAVGYTGTSRFGVAFKERYQMSPAQYRRMHENVN